MKSAAVPVVTTRGHQIAVQVETVAFWDLVPLLQPRPQSSTPPSPLPGAWQQPGGHIPVPLDSSLAPVCHFPSGRRASRF